MNPATKATTVAQQIERAVIIVRTMQGQRGIKCAASYIRKHLKRADQLTAFQAIKRAVGSQAASHVMRGDTSKPCDWTLEAALLTLCGAASLERHFQRIEGV